jgi:hypothetical protein
VTRPSPHAAEARARWGDTEAFRESQRRAASYGGADWRRIQGEAAAIESRLALALASGADPRGEIAMDLAEQHRQHLSRWFYECSPALHRGLGDLYVNDPRFTAHYDAVAAGLASYLCAAIHANADRLDTV